jgi:hypothetical protein
VVRLRGWLVRGILSVASVYHWYASRELELLLISFGATAFVAFTQSRTAGALVLVVAATSSFILLWPAVAPTTTEQVLLSNSMTVVRSVVPPYGRSTGLAVALFAICSFGAVALVCRRGSSSWAPAGFAALAVASLVPVTAWSGKWSLFWSWIFPTGLEASLLLGALGLIFVGSSVALSEANERQ